MRIPFVPRKKNTLNSLHKIHGTQATLVASEGEIFYMEGNKRYGFHPSMAWNRLSILEKGKGDRLLEVSGVQAGDHILDCTCGMAGDAMVLSWAVGTAGSVTALEASPILEKIVSYGLQNYQTEKSYIQESMRRIVSIAESYKVYLKKQASNSYDYVFLDPMFQKTYTHIKGLDLVRQFAEYSLPTREDIAQAKRVARKKVILKDRVPGHLLEDLHPPLRDCKRRIWYGIWPVSVQSS